MSTDRDVIKQHNSWLTLIEASGPFLSIPVLIEAFPHGLDAPDDEAEQRRRLRLAYDEWADNQHGNRPDVAIHTQWVRFVLEEVLGMRSDAILEGQSIASEISYTTREHEVVRPSLVIRSPYEPQPRLLVQVYPHTLQLKKVVPGTTFSPETRMMELLRTTNVRLGMVTNGEQWMLVDALRDEPTGYYSWYTSLWLDEPITLRAFRSLLSMERFFNVPEGERLEALLTKSALHQQEVTIQLGDQVRRAIEVLVQTLDRLDKDSQRVLLHDVDEKTLYDAALTVMMRLVFLLFAEERDLLQLDNPLYADNYAVSTMHKQLREQADQHGEEVLSLRHDAWSRLLALFRLVFGGVSYQDLHVPAYGGRLFNPDRFPFLEGRSTATTWYDTPAQPLLIDNRTVLHLLNALQYLHVRVPGGGTESRRISFKGLDVEQVGHVYEGLLEHTAKRATTAILGIVGKSDTEPEATLEVLEQHATKGRQELLAFLQERTTRSLSALQKSLIAILDEQQRSRLMEACDNRQEVFERIVHFAGLLRRDSFNNYVIVTPGSVYVTKGDDRRSTGTHYTPRSLTEPLVKHALDPLVYVGPAEGLAESEWQLRPVADLLDLKVCDMAMGSGAFLVQACRYLSERLVEAWERIEQSDANTRDDKRIPLVLPDCHLSQGKPDEELLPTDSEERLAVARRIVCERCLYGVDKNPMAVEMAKLSLWLITLAKDRPFTFLDHALRVGDSLLGVHTQQLMNWSLDSQQKARQTVWIEPAIKRAVDIALKLRLQISTLPGHTVRDVDEKAKLLFEAQGAIEVLKLGADLLIATALLPDAKQRGLVQDTLHMQYFLLLNTYEQAREIRYTTAVYAADDEEFYRMRAEVDKLLQGRHFFHWPLEFPEVFTNNQGGFSAIVSNPPFQGGQKITGAVGTNYRDYLVQYLANGKRGSADLCAYFFLRATLMVRHNGMIALLATNSIAQGDSRKVGLDQIVASGCTIPRAISSRKWPGEASLEVAHIWIRDGEWHGSYVLNDIVVDSITSFLTTSGKAQGEPLVLQVNMDKSFQGSIVLGKGFILQPEQAQALVTKDPRNKDVLFPYLNGEDLNSSPDQSPSRWVINFHDWPLEVAETYPECIKIVREKVKPERDLNNRKVRRERWWQFAERAVGLYSTIADMERVLIRAQVSKTWGWTFVFNNCVYDAKTIVFAFDRYIEFSILQNTFHWEWSIQYGTTLRLDMSYTPTRNFETFPFPTNTDNLDDIGERYYNHRQSIMQERQEGLTKTYNRFHNPQEISGDIVRLRELHREMDELVAQAYRWDDLCLEHGFHETKQGIRYTISEAARREVLDRLLLLNHQRYEEEQREGVMAKKGGKGKRKSEKHGSGKQGKMQNGQGNGMLDFTSDVVEIDTSVQQETLFE